MRKLSKPDVLWLGLYSLIILLFISTSIIRPDSQFGTVYGKFIGYSLPLLALAIIGIKALPFSAVFIGDTRKFKEMLAVGVGIGCLFGISYLFKTNFALLSPLAIPGIVTGASALGLVAGIAIMVAEMEETLRASLVYPSLKDGILQERGYLVAATLGLLALIILPTTLPALILFGFAGFIFITKNTVLDDQRIKRLIALAGSALFFSFGLHLLAYGGNDALLWSAFIFAVVVDFANDYFKSTLPSRFAHVTNNALAGAALAGLGAWTGFLIVGAYALVMFFISRGDAKAVAI